MRRDRRVVYAVAFGCACGWLLLGGGEARTQDQGDAVADFLAKTQARRDKVRSVRYVMTGKGMTAKGVFGDPMGTTKKRFPERDHQCDIRLTWLLDFEKNRLRKGFQGQVSYMDTKGGRFIPKSYIHVYDGSGSKRLFPRGENTSSDYSPPERGTDLGVIKNGNNASIDVTDFPVFLTHGIVSTTRHPIDGAKLFRQPLVAGDYLVRGRTVLRERTCTILRTTPVSTPGRERNYEEFWVELDRGLVLREDDFLEGELYIRTDIEYQGEDLKSWVTTEFKNNYGRPRAVGETRPAIPADYVAGQVVRSSRFTVQEFEANPVLKAEDFDVIMKPGMNVTVVDAKAKIETEFDRKEYRVAADGKTLEEIIDGKVVRKPSLLLIVTVGLALGGAVYAVFWIRKRRR